MYSQSLPMTVDKQLPSLPVNTIATKILRARLLTPSNDKYSSPNPEDAFSNGNNLSCAMYV